MSRLTTDPTDHELGRGVDTAPTEQNPAYLVLSDEEIAKGLVRPVRQTYVHTFMLDGSKVPVVLTNEHQTGGCGAATTMSIAIAETYARNPSFYGSTYCVRCQMHLPVNQFHWDDDFTAVGS